MSDLREAFEAFIGLPALQVSGGLLLALIALDLLRPAGDLARAADAGYVAFVPLGTPLLAGPARSRRRCWRWNKAPGLTGQAMVAAALMRCCSWWGSVAETLDVWMIAAEWTFRGSSGATGVTGGLR